MAQDEARFGLISWHKRRYCLQGYRPPCIQRREYKWTWLYAAVEPMTGEQFCLYLPNLDGDCFDVFLQELSEQYPDDLIILVLDNAPAHKKADLAIPDNIILFNLPPYSPQLNPVERWFQEFRRELANQLFDSIEHIHQVLRHLLKQFRQDKERLQLLTNFPWWWFAITQLHYDFGHSG